MDLTEYRSRQSEQERSDDLMRLVPSIGGRALDVGARDGYFSRLLAEHFESVVALDLEKPEFNHDKVECVAGDVTKLDYPDQSYDLVFCAEVLEHIPPGSLAQACNELARVTKHFLLIGVPYNQDIRIGRTTCLSCGGTNPPWGHINVFDENKLMKLFPSLEPKEFSFVGQSLSSTNAFATYLMDLAGNPYGTYSQAEPCIHCGEKLIAPAPLSFPKKVLTFLALLTRKIKVPSQNEHPNWIHVLIQRSI